MRCRPFQRLACGLALLLLSESSTLAFLSDRYLSRLSDSRPGHFHPLFDTSTLASSIRHNDDETTTPLPARYPKSSQIRKKPQSRRPRGYWQDIANVDQELRELWQQQANITIPKSTPPPIPNESLLNYWKRHDLRAAIATHGGRELLAEELSSKGRAMIIPGKWADAVQIPMVQRMVLQDPQLSMEYPPLSPQQLATKNKAKIVQETKETRELRWRHSSDRKPRGYWSSSEVVIKELYIYLQERSQRERIPQVWMPRLSELQQAGRDDLMLAIRRFGGQSRICRLAGLVTFREWNYIEGQYELLLGLKEYLDRYHSGDYTMFPAASVVKGRGYDRLYSLIQYYGGVRFLAARFDMKWAAAGAEEESGRRRRRTTTKEVDLLSADMYWGPFDLEFGIDLFAFVREQELKKTPPLQRPEIRIPSQLTLLEHGERGLRLDEKIQEYGGYENMARRLGLAFE